jgi:hypothetical protein
LTDLEFGPVEPHWIAYQKDSRLAEFFVDTNNSVLMTQTVLVKLLAEAGYEPLKLTDEL